jgi:hypothetical protein
MKRSEWIGLGIVLSLLVGTYLFDHFYPLLRSAMETRTVKASATVPEPRDERVFKPLHAYTAKKAYYRYELVEIIAEYRDYDREPITSGTLTAKIYFNKQLVKSVADLSEVNLTYDPKAKCWRGLFPVPWNPPLGEYEALVTARPDNPGPVLKDTSGFRIIGREPPQVPQGLAVMAVENYSDLNTRKIPAPDGTFGDWRNILGWADYMGADAVFCLAGMTDGEKRYDKNKNLLIFRPDILQMTKKLSAEAHRRGLLYGAWVMTFMMQVGNYEKFGYMPSLGYNGRNDSVTTSYHISIGDRKRLDDIIEVVKELDRNPNVDFIGLDYIRTGLDGYELVNEVVADMSIPIPSDWEKMGPRERIVWFARKIETEKDETTIEKWRWWRAHKVALNVKEIIDRSGTKKPVWLYTLGWEHGKQHGQDPLMFNDAGIAYDAVMLYEANSQQFRQVLVDWKKYLRARQVNILCGNSVDVTLLDSTVLTPPEEIVRRTITGSQQLLFGGLTDGVFWHDLTRTFWGRRGEYSAKEWCVTGGTCFSRYREEKGLSPVALRVRTEDSALIGAPFKVNAHVENISLDVIRDVKVSLEEVEGLVPGAVHETRIPELHPGESVDCVFDASFRSVPDRFRYSTVVPVKVIYEGKRSHFNFQMVRVRHKSGDPAASASVSGSVPADAGVIKLKDDSETLEPDAPTD